MAQGRRVAAGLDTGVEGIEATAGGKPDRILLIELIDGWLEFHEMERRARPDQRIVPQPAMKEHFAGMGFVVTRPLNSAHLFKSPVAHSRMHRAGLAQFVPEFLGIGAAPIVAETAS